MKIHVASRIDPKAIGTGFGYNVKTTRLIHELQKYFEFGPDASVHLHFMPPMRFNPTPGKINWLITTVETHHLLPDVVESLNSADEIVVPSYWCRGILDQYLPGKSIWTVPHGVDHSVFKFVPRSLPPTKWHRFRYLYLGANTPRKGIDELLYVWEAAGFAKQLNVELYCKVSVEADDNRLDHILTSNNVVMDYRVLSAEELATLYGESHCLVIPTRGEGFCLPAAEALATGMPVIITNNGGHLDYVNDKTGYLVKYDEVTIDRRLFHQWELSEEDMKTEAEKVPSRVPNAGDLVDKMLYVAHHYPEALAKGIEGSKRMEGFTWQAAGRFFADLLMLTEETRTYGSYHEGRSEGRVGSQGLG